MSLERVLAIAFSFAALTGSIVMATAATPNNSTSPTPAAFLALGDSYTIGEGAKPHERWPMQLAQKLRDEGVAINDPEIVATTGWTTEELSAAMDAHTFHPPYTLVTLLIGVNDQYRGGSVADYRPRFTRLLKRAITLAGANAKHVVVVSIPDWGVTRFAQASGRDISAISIAIDAYNAAAKEICRAHGVAFVDVTAASRRADNADDMLMSDGLHPSAKQYSTWVDAILPVARTALQ